MFSHYPFDFYRIYSDVSSDIGNLSFPLFLRPPLSRPPGTDRAGALRPAGKASAVASGDPLAAVRAAAVCPAFAPGGQRFAAYKE